MVEHKAKVGRALHKPTMPASGGTSPDIDTASALRAQTLQTLLRRLTDQLLLTKMTRAVQAGKEKQAFRQGPTNGQSCKIWSAIIPTSEAGLAEQLLLIEKE